MELPDKKYYLLKVNVIISQKDNKPILELRRKIQDTKLLKMIISCVFHKRPLMIVPSFSDELRGLNSLQEKGIIYFDTKKREYKFNI